MKNVRDIQFENHCFRQTLVMVPIAVKYGPVKFCRKLLLFHKDVYLHLFNENRLIRFRLCAF